MRLALWTLAMLAGCGHAHLAPTPLGDLAPWSLATWFGECSAPLQVSDEGITSLFACKDHPGPASWKIDVNYTGQIVHFTVAGRDRSELRETFETHAEKLLGATVAARLRSTLNTDDRRIDGDDIEITRLSTPGGLLPAVEQIRWFARVKGT